MGFTPTLNGKSRLAVSTRGVEDIQIYQLSSTDVPLSTPASLGYVKSVDFKQEGSIIEIIDGLGDMINAVASGKKVTINAVVLQTSKEMIDVIANTDDNYYAVYIKAKTANGNFQEIHIPLARIKPSAQINYSNSERTTSVEISVLLGKHTVATNIEVGAGAAVISLPAGDYFVITEGAVEQGTFKTATSDALYANFV